MRRSELPSYCFRPCRSRPAAFHLSTAAVVCCFFVFFVSSVVHGASARASAAYRRNPWTLHDPSFPVQVDVAPFRDELWAAENADTTTNGDVNVDDVLHVSSTVLHVTVRLPDAARAEDAQVTLTLFESTDDSINAAAKTEKPPQFELFADSELKYVRQYRVAVDPDKADKRFVLRVYVEASAAHHNATDVGPASAKLRAFYVRWLDLRPSEPHYLVCEEQDGSADDDEAEEDEHVQAQPPANLPRGLCHRYTMAGRVPVRKWYFDDQTNVGRSYGEQYSRQDIDALVQDAKTRVEGHSHVDKHLYQALDQYLLTDKHVLVVGSTGFPWPESVCLASEAASCTTVSHRRLRLEHSKLKAFTTAEFDADVALEATRRFDAVFVISTLASEGLGRAGDPLDPDADLKAMRELLQLATPPCTSDSSEEREPMTVFLSVPVGPDTLVWNAQRHYGPLRLPLLLQDWKVLDSFGFQQSDLTADFSTSHFPLFVLQAPSASCDASSEDAGHGEHSEL